MKSVHFDFEKDEAPALKFPRPIRPIRGRPSGNGPQRPVKSAEPANHHTVEPSAEPVVQAVIFPHTATSSTKPINQDDTRKETWTHVTTKAFTGMVPSWAPSIDDPGFAEFADFYLVPDIESKHAQSTKPAAPVEQDDGDFSDNSMRDSVQKYTKQLEDRENGYKKQLEDMEKSHKTQLEDMEKSYKKQLTILHDKIARNSEAHSNELSNNAQKFKLGMADLEIQATEAQETLALLQKHDTEQRDYIQKQARHLRQGHDVLANAQASIAESQKTVAKLEKELAKAKDLLRTTYRNLQDSQQEVVNEKAAVETATSSLEEEKVARTKAEAEVVALREKYEALRSSDLSQFLEAANQSLEQSTAEVANLTLYRDNFKRQLGRVQVEMKKVQVDNADLTAELEGSKQEFRDLRQDCLHEIRRLEKELATARTKAIDQDNEISDADGGPPSPAFGPQSQTPAPALQVTQGTQTQSPPPAPQASEGTQTDDFGIQTDDLGPQQVLALSEVLEISMEPTMAAAAESDQDRSGAGGVPGMVPIIVIFIIIMMMLMMMMGHRNPWTVRVTSWRTGMGCGRRVPEWLWEDPFLELSGSLFG